MQSPLRSPAVYLMPGPCPWCMVLRLTASAENAVSDTLAADISVYVDEHRGLPSTNRAQVHGSVPSKPRG